jgi:hypothetical protein
MICEISNFKRTSKEELVNLILQRYAPGFHYLRDFERVDNNNIEGSFFVKGSVHVTDRDMYHLAITELQMCLNQFFQVQMAYLVETGYFEGVPPIRFKDYWPNSDEYLFVVDEHLRFKKHISPGKVFYGHLEMVDKRVSRKGYYHMNFDFDFDNGAHDGTLRLAFNPIDLLKNLNLRNTNV